MGGGNPRIGGFADHRRSLTHLGLLMRLPLTIDLAEYPHDYVTPRHCHSHTRFLRAINGVLIVSTSQGVWIAPPGHGLLIPFGAQHDAHMLGRATLQILDIERAPDFDFAETCFVIGVSPLLANLADAAQVALVDPTSNRRQEAIAALLLHEIQTSLPEPLFLPLPADEVLHQRCSAFLQQPDSADTIDLWSSALNMSRRTFTRRFKSQTGLSFVAWRQRACLIAAVPRLINGEAVRIVASSLGFKRQASFAALFRRWLGIAPIAFQGAHGRFHRRRS